MENLLKNKEKMIKTRKIACKIDYLSYLSDVNN